MNYELYVTQQEAQFLINSLAQLPYFQSAGLIAKLSQQLQNQDEAKATPASDIVGNGPNS